MGTAQINITLHRKLEEKLHEALHRNLSILTFAYPPSTEFTNVLKQGMFKKSNPNAFLHTAHYLLNIIDKGNFKSKFEWPLYEKRMETTFRNTFRSFMTELNDKYPFAKLPEVKVSYMVTPGGFHFTTMMLKLCELAIILYLKRNEKDVCIENENESIEQDHIKTIIKEKCDHFNSKLKYRIAYRDKFFKAVENEAELIQNQITVLKRKVDNIKENWKQYIFDVPDLTDTERHILVYYPKQAIEVLKAEVMKQLNKNCELNKLLEQKKNSYEEIEHMSDVLLQRAESNHCLHYDGDLKDTLAIRKYVAEDYIPHVDRIVSNGILNFPLLLNCLASVFHEINPLIPQRKRNEGAMISIVNNCEKLTDTTVEFRKLNNSVCTLNNDLQAALNQARSDFENKPGRADAIITSITSFWPASSPYRDLKFYNDENSPAILNLLASRSRSMLDISAVVQASDHSGNRTILQPAWLMNSNMMTVKKQKRKPMNKESEQYRSSPCLHSPKSTSQKLDFNYTNGDSITSSNLTNNVTGKKVQTIKNGFDVSDNFVTPIKQSRKSILPKLKEIGKRLSFIPDEMPMITLNSIEIKSPCAKLDVIPSLDNQRMKSNEKISKLTPVPNIVDDEVIDECLSASPFRNKYVENLIQTFSAKPSKRISIGAGESLLNISSPIDFNHTLDSD